MISFHLDRDRDRHVYCSEFPSIGGPLNAQKLWVHRCVVVAYVSMSVSLNMHQHKSYGRRKDYGQLFVVAIH